MTSPVVADPLIIAADATAWGLTELPDLHRLAAQAAVRGYCRWHIAPRVELVVVLDLDGSGIALLPAMNVTAVSAVLDGSPVADLQWSANGVVEVPRRIQRRALTITFTAGYVAVPDDVKGAALSVAARSAESPTGEVRESAGPFSVQHSTVGSQAGGVLLTDAERAVLAPYRLPLA